MVLFTMALTAVLLPLELHAEKLSQVQTAPRPRWQCLALALTWLALAAALFLAARDLTGWPQRACGVTGLWPAAFGLAMAGRAAAWGRARNLFWWHRPRWAQPPAPVGTRATAD